MCKEGVTPSDIHHSSLVICSLWRQKQLQAALRSSGQGVPTVEAAIRKFYCITPKWRQRRVDLGVGLVS
jgi:hypothetical protein